MMKYEKDCLRSSHHDNSSINFGFQHQSASDSGDHHGNPQHSLAWVFSLHPS
jgi:hypothetical protein